MHKYSSELIAGTFCFVLSVLIARNSSTEPDTGFDVIVGLGFGLGVGDGDGVGVKVGVTAGVAVGKTIAAVGLVGGFGWKSC